MKKKLKYLLLILLLLFYIAIGISLLLEDYVYEDLSERQIGGITTLFAFLSVIVVCCFWEKK